MSLQQIEIFFSIVFVQEVSVVKYIQQVKTYGRLTLVFTPSIRLMEFRRNETDI